ncbi:hypothetical protein WDV93_00595 [Pantoea ananatis]
MMEETLFPAMQEVAKELELRGAEVTLDRVAANDEHPLGYLDLRVPLGEEQDFLYQVWPQQYSIPGFTYRARSGKSTYYRLETFLLEGEVRAMT